MLKELAREQFEVYQASWRLANATGELRPDAIIELTTGIRKVRFGDPAPEGIGAPVTFSRALVEGMRAGSTAARLGAGATSCRGCGAPPEPGQCSYCLRPWPQWPEPSC